MEDSYLRASIQLTAHATCSLARPRPIGFSMLGVSPNLKKGHGSHKVSYRALPWNSQSEGDELDSPMYWGSRLPHVAPSMSAGQPERPRIPRSPINVILVRRCSVISCVQKRTCPAESQSTCACTLNIAARTQASGTGYMRDSCRAPSRVWYTRARHAGIAYRRKNTRAPLPRQREQRPSESGSIGTPAFYQGTELELRASRNDGRAGLDAYFLTSVACVIVEVRARARSEWARDGLLSTF